MGDDDRKLSMDEIEAEDAVSLPNKEVMSLLDGTRTSTSGSTWRRRSTWRPPRT